MIYFVRIFETRNHLKFAGRLGLERFDNLTLLNRMAIQRFHKLTRLVRKYFTKTTLPLSTHPKKNRGRNNY